LDLYPFTMQTVWWLVWKNILIKKRGWTSLITELLIPLAFVGLLAYLYDLSEGNEFPAKTFLISSNQVFSPRLLPWELQRSNQKIGLIGDDDTIESFLATADLEYPGFSIETALGVSLDDNSTLHALTTPKFSEVCERFDSNSQLEEHIQKQGYGHIHTIQMIFSAISFSKGAPHWDYSIRTNGTNQQYRAGEHTEDRRRGSNAGSIHAYLEVAQTASGLTKVQGDNDDDELDEEDVSLKDGWAPGFLTLQHLVDNYIVGHNAWAPPTTGPGRRLPGGPPQDTAKSIVDELTVAFDGYASKVGSELMTLMAVLNTTEGAALLPSMKEGISNFTRAESTQKISRPLIQQFPTGEFTQGRFYAMLGALFAFFWIIFTMFPVSHLIKQVVSERESKIEEGMRMMGVKAFTLQLSWMLTFGAIFVLLVIGTVIISTSTFFQCSSPSMIFLFFLLWFVAVLCMSYLFSVFFSRAKTASTLSKILFLASYAPYASVTGDTVSTSTKVLGCLLAPISFAFGLDVIVEYEGNDQCLLWESVAIAPTTDSLSMQTSLIMLAADSLIYLILGWYLGNVLPREYGSPRPWYFVFAPDFWRGVFGKKKTLPTRPSDIEMKEAKGEGSDAGDDDHSADIEEVNVEMKLQEQRGDCVSIKGIRREFSTPQGKLVAVNDVDLSMFQDQIFVLLGHNGAGKTTLINLLSGMIAPTSGDATVYGKSVVDDMEFIRDMIGVCPQHDVLFPELTVEEHLKLFMGMKGVTVKDQDKAVKEYIADVGLTEKTHTASKFLSGGQKRKLSVAIALCGDSKVIFLDEPTSGMDPYSRRSTWNSLLNKRSGRIMILTTHFMDEADMLGDRIAIMAHGKVRCCGSSMFLKQRFGVGYSLQCVKSAATTHDSDELLSETIRSHVEGAKMLSNVAAEVSYQLPLASSEAFPALFNELDSRGEELGLENYGISATSMEEVFIRVAREGDRDDQEEGKKMQTEMMERRESVSTLSVEDGGPKVRDAVDRANPLETTNVITVFCWHVWALLLKRFNYMRRDVKGMMFQVKGCVCVCVYAVGLDGM
jgi:ATP-binding cassette subfamily A (ABC1) protein 1